MDASAKILIVEDDPISQRVTQLAIEGMGYNVDIASTGEEAIKLYKSTNYALIFMDFGLPDMTGEQVTQKIRQLEKDARRVPIIALTAHVFHSDKQRCLTAGMDGFLGKPLDLAELKQTLNQWAKPN
jgi:CheY-like chemotaxis protein